MKDERIDWGAVAEYATASELLALGFTPCWPSVETQPFDMIAASAGLALRIQVKGTHSKGPKVRLSVVMRAGGARKRGYTKDDVDFIIIKLFAFDLTYIIPVSKIQKDMVIKPADPACKWQRFKENWALLK